MNAAGTIPDKEDKMRAQLQWVVGLNTFEKCILNADGTHLVQLTDNALFEGTVARSVDGGGRLRISACSTMSTRWSARRTAGRAGRSSFTSRTNRSELKAACAKGRNQSIDGLHRIQTVGSRILVMPVMDDDDVAR